MFALCSGNCEHSLANSTFGAEWWNLTHQSINWSHTLEFDHHNLYGNHLSLIFISKWCNCIYLLWMDSLWYLFVRFRYLTDGAFLEFAAMCNAFLVCVIITKTHSCLVLAVISWHMVWGRTLINHKQCTKKHRRLLAGHTWAQFSSSCQSSYLWLLKIWNPF